MLVGDNESATTKNAGELLVISIAMQMQRCDAGLGLELGLELGLGLGLGFVLSV